MRSQKVIYKEERKKWPLDRDTGSESLRTRFPKTTTNFCLDVLLLGALSANLLTPFVNPRLHIRSGMILVLILNIHLFLHRRILESVLKRSWKWLPNAALLMAFVFTVLSGMIVALIYAPNVSDFHRLSVVVFSILVVIHLYANRKWIARRFKA